MKKAGWTVRSSGPDCPAASGGPSAGAVRTVRWGGADRPRGSLGLAAVLDVLDELIDCPHRGAGPSAHLADCPQGRHRLSARAARRWVTGRREISHQPFLLLPKPQETFIPLSFLLSLKEKALYLGISMGHSPDRPSTSPDSPRDSPSCHLGIFFTYLILSLGFRARK
jgi:hypothetical protein